MAVPIVLLVVHGAVFGAEGAAWIVGLLLLCGGGAYAMVTNAALRERSLAEVVGFVRKPIVAGMALTAIVIIEVLAIRAGAPARRLRREALAALNGADPCAVERLPRDVFVELGRDDDHDNRLAQCRQAALVAEEQQRAALCLALADRIGKGQVLPDDAAWLGASAPLVKRIADGALDPDDLKLEAANLPCGDALIPLFLAATTKATKAWAAVNKAGDVSYLVSSRLAKATKPALSTDAANALHSRVEMTAVRTLRAAKTADELRPAKALCDLEGALLNTGGATCKRVASRLDALEKQEAAAAKMKEAADRAKEERCDALREQTAACNLRCMDRFEPDDPRADNCANRCDARLQASGCL